MIAREYRYSVDPAGRIQSSLGEAWGVGGSMLLDGTPKTNWLRPFDASQRDLLRVAASILCADRMSPRRDARFRRAARDLAWQRTIRLRVAVEDPTEMGGFVRPSRKGALLHDR
jgi:hypothetical protein